MADKKSCPACFIPYKEFIPNKDQILNSQYHNRICSCGLICDPYLLEPYPFYFKTFRTQHLLINIHWYPHLIKSKICIHHRNDTNNFDEVEINYMLPWDISIDKIRLYITLS